MKKIKLLPSIIMLALCLAVLGIGVYSATTGSNTITGTLTVNSAGYEVDISVYQVTDSAHGSLIYTGVYGNQIGTTQTSRKGVNISLGNSLAFNSDQVNTLDAVTSIEVLIKVENKAGVALGAYFSETAATTSLASKAGAIRALVLNGESSVSNAAGVTVSGYQQIAASGTTYYYMNFTLNQLYTDAVTINMANNPLYLNVEAYQSSMVDTSGDALKSARWASDIGWYLPMGQGKDSSNNTVSLRWRPIGRSGAMSGGSTTISGEAGSYTATSTGNLATYNDIHTETMTKLYSDTYTFLQAEGYKFLSTPSGSSNGANYPFDDDSGEYVGSQIQTFINTASNLSTYYGINTSTDAVYTKILEYVSSPSTPQQTSSPLTPEIIESDTITYDLTSGSAGGNSKKLYLLSILEVLKQYTYLETQSNRVYIQYATSSVGSADCWWTRSWDYGSSDSAFWVQADGGIEDYYQYVANCNAVRPAFKIEL